jgi:hypothetical protein
MPQAEIREADLHRNVPPKLGWCLHFVSSLIPISRVTSYCAPRPLRLNHGKMGKRDTPERVVPELLLRDSSVRGFIPLRATGILQRATLVTIESQG